jgi:hypothetical protein
VAEAACSWIVIKVSAAPGASPRVVGGPEIEVITVVEYEK